MERDKKPKATLRLSIKSWLPDVQVRNETGRTIEKGEVIMISIDPHRQHENIIEEVFD